MEHEDGIKRPSGENFKIINDVAIYLFGMTNTVRNNKHHVIPLSRLSVGT